MTRQQKDQISIIDILIAIYLLDISPKEDHVTMLN